MKKILIKDLQPGGKVETYFLLTKKNRKLTKNDKPYLELTLTDKTGKIEGRVWDNADEFDGKAETGDVVSVEGSVELYREEKQIKVISLDKMRNGSSRQEDLVRVVPEKDLFEKKVKGLLSSIGNQWIKKLADNFVSDDDLFSRFIEGAGAKSWHNAYVGGLLEHTYEVMYIADKICDLYPQADRDMVILGAFLHDIGKTYELDPKKMEYTVEGGLVGHIAIGYKLLLSKISGISGFPGDLSMRLEHIVLSHHGEYEQQSPVLPKTLEATIVYQVDALVSQANAVKEIQIRQPDKDWSPYVSIKSRKYYTKDYRSEDWARSGKGERPGSEQVKSEKEEGEKADLRADEFPHSMEQTSDDSDLFG